VDNSSTVEATGSGRDGSNPVAGRLQARSRYVRILIVSEEPVLGVLIAEWARMQNHEAITVDDPMTAPHRVSATHPDAVILDVEKATMADLLRRMRASVPGVRAIVISSGPAAEIGAILRGLGGTAVVEKPIALDALAGTLALLVSTSPTG
jgi:DNA-binding response OmpR family regulator